MRKFNLGLAISLADDNNGERSSVFISSKVVFVSGSRNTFEERLLPPSVFPS